MAVVASDGGVVGESLEVTLYYEYDRGESGITSLYADYYD